MIKSIFYNYNYAIILTDDGKVYSWGKNNQGQLGLGHTKNENKPKLIQFPNNAKIKCVSSTSSSSMAIDEEGNLYVWGSNEFCQLGIPDDNNILEPRKVTIYCNTKKKELKVKKVFCSIIGSMVITEDDKLYSCGWNDFYSLGVDNFELCNLSIISLPNDVGVKSIEFLDRHSFVIGVDGSVYSCGLNEYYQLGLEKGYEVFFFKRVCLPEKSKVIKVSSTDYNVIALTDNGELYSWGKNTNGQLGTGDKEDNKIPIKISLPNGIKAKDVLTTKNNSFSIGEDGNLYAWGKFKHRELKGEKDIEELHPKLISFPNGVKPICINGISISIDNYFGYIQFIVCDDGNLYAIEYSYYNDREFFLPLDITKDNEDYLPKRVNILNEINIKSIFANKSSILIVSEDDTLYALGDNKDGQLGIGSEKEKEKTRFIKIELPN